LRYHQGGKIQKAKEKLSHPTCLPFAELFATFEAFATFASLQVCILTLIPFSPFSKETNSLNRKSN